MYREYAKDPRMRLNLGIRRRLAPLMDNDRRQIELLYSLLFSLPGSPVLYYGDEIGMGDNIYLGDRHGVRTPMQWTGDRNAGFSRGTRRSYIKRSCLIQSIIITPLTWKRSSARPHPCFVGSDACYGFVKSIRSLGAAPSNSCRAKIAGWLLTCANIKVKSFWPSIICPLPHSPPSWICANIEAAFRWNY